HAVLGNLLGMKENFAQARTELETAMRLNPGSADILATYSGWGSTFGDPEGGANAADRALRMNPNYPAAQTSSFSYAYLMVNRCEDVLRLHQRDSEGNRSKYDWMQVASCLGSLGRKNEATMAVTEAVRRFP